MATNRGKSKPLAETIAERGAADTAERARVGVDALGQLPSEATIHVWRRDDETKEYAATGVTFAPEEFSVEKVRELLGGGVYQARIMVLDESGRKIPGGQRQFRTEGPRKMAPAQNGGSGVAGQAALSGDVRTGPPPSSSRESIIDMGLMGIFNQMQENSKMSMLMMKEMLEARKGGLDWAAILPAIVPAFTALVTMMGSRKDPTEIAAELLDKMKSPATSGAGEFLKTAEAMVRLRDLMGNSGGGNGEQKDVAQTALEIFGPVVAEIITAKRGEGAGAHARAVVRPGTGGGAATAVQSTAVPAIAPGSDGTNVVTAGADNTGNRAEAGAVNEAAWVAALRPHIGQLVRIAATGKDPYDFAHTVMSFFMPEQHKGTIRELVAPGTEQAAQLMVEAFPQLSTYWTLEFVDGVRQELCPELYDDVDDDDADDASDADVPKPETAP